MPAPGAAHHRRLASRMLLTDTDVAGHACATHRQRGLDSALARHRLAADGLNALPTRDRHGVTAIARRVMREPVFLLLSATAGLHLATGAMVDAVVLAICFAAIFLLTVLRERRAAHAVAALRERTQPTSLAIRDGRPERIATNTLVRGDLIVLSAGDRVPADGLLREAERLSIDESLLTGASVPAGKMAAPALRHLDRPGDAGSGSVYAGTLVAAGHGIAEVVATGARTALATSRRTADAVPVIPNGRQHATGRFVRNVAIVGGAAGALLMILVALTRGGLAADWQHGALAGLALMLAALPHGLPTLIALCLALGAWRIARANVVVRRLRAIETLGAATVLCTDKTGTLTTNRMQVVRAVVDGEDVDCLAPTATPALHRLLTTARLACRPTPFDPLEHAIHAACDALPDGAAEEPGLLLEHTYAPTSDLPATTQAWRHSRGDGHLIAAYGTPDAIAGLCGLTLARRDLLAGTADALAGRGLRVLAVAGAVMAGDLIPHRQRDLDLDFIGLLGLADPLRPEAPAAIATCRAAGIRVVMLTGDGPTTALSIARQAGIDVGNLVLTGAQLERMSDAALAIRVRWVQVFAGLTPPLKLRLVTALQAGGDVVAMTGDGANDIPALRAADVGIAMGGRGCDVAREAADLVLRDDDFGAIVAAIRHGRGISHQLRQAIDCTIAVQVPIVGLALLPACLPAAPLLLLPIHIVLIELAFNVVCTLVYEAEPATDELMARPPQAPGQRLFTWRRLAGSLAQGGCALAACLAVFLLLRGTHDDDSTRAATIITLSAAMGAVLIANRAQTQPLWRTLRTPSRALAWSAVAILSLLALAFALPAAQSHLHVRLPAWPDLALGLGAGLGCLGACLLIVRRRRRTA